MTLVFSVGVIMPAVAFVPGYTIYGISASNPAVINEWDPVTKALVNSFPVDCANSPTTPDCLGRGIAFDGQNLWYTVIDARGDGSGQISKIATTGGSDITTIPDPYGIGKRGIGAMDYHFGLGQIVAISHLPENGFEEITVINPANGAVTASCNVPFGGGGLGTETLVVDEAAGTFWTNAGLWTLHFINEYRLPVGVQGLCTQTDNVNPVAGAGVGGVDFDTVGSLIVMSSGIALMQDVNGYPWAGLVDSFTTTGYNNEDITIVPKSQIVGGTLVPIDSTSLLIAGAQMNAAWMIPAFASIVGASLFFLRKTKFAF